MIVRRILRAPDEGGGGGTGDSGAGGQGGTGGEGTGGEEQPAYFSQLSPEFRASERAKGLHKYAKLNDLATAVLDMEERSARSVVIPDAANPDPEEMKRFREAVGLPDSEDGYEIQASEGAEELVKFIRKNAFGMRLTRTQAQRLFDLFGGVEKANRDARSAAQKQAAETFPERLLQAVDKDESKRDATVNLFKAFLVKRIGDKDLVNRIAQSGLVHDPQFAVAMAKIEDSFAEEPFFKGAPNGGAGDKASGKAQGHFGKTGYSPDFQQQFGGRQE